MKCNKCGEKKATIKDRDPYIEEIGDDDSDEGNPIVWWCDDCYQEAIANI